MGKWPLKGTIACATCARPTTVGLSLGAQNSSNILKLDQTNAASFCHLKVKTDLCRFTSLCHSEIWEYCQSTSRVQAQVLQNLRVCAGSQVVRTSDRGTHKCPTWLQSGSLAPVAM